MTRQLQTRFASAEQSPGYLLWRVTNAWQAHVRAALAPFGLTHVQFVLLATLAHDDGESGMTQAQLAARARTDPMMTSQVLRALEGKDLVARTPHPTDRRAKSLSVTREGARLASEANAEVEAADAAFFAATPSERRTLVDHLVALDRSE